MSAADLDSWVKLLGAMAGVLGAVTVLARTLLKWFPPRSVSLTAEMATMREEAASVKAELAEARQEIAALRQEMRLLTDYAHDLREHVALEKDPPPPDWPVGLRL